MKADSPYPLTTVLPKGYLLLDRGPARGLNDLQIIRDLAFVARQAPLVETKLYGLDNRLKEICDILVAWAGYFMKKCPLIFPANIGTIQDQEMKV